MERTEVLVVGAGVAGLTCARSLRAAGLEVLVLERSRGVGGRCATRRVHDQPVDHGVIFLHGDDPAFRAAIEAVDASPLEGWPQRVRGSGQPCQPAAFTPRQWRVAFAEGVNAFPKSLARDLDVRLLENVDRLALRESYWHIHTGEGHEYCSRDLVLALALEQTRRLLPHLSSTEPKVLGIDRLLSSFATLPCLTLLAGYGRSAPELSWDVFYPEDGSCLLLVSHDSTKRGGEAERVLVYQAQPAWSRQRLDADPGDWSAEMLREAARLLGPWAAEPAWAQTHVWRYSRLDAGNELVCPVALTLAGGARLVLTGELFSAGGGVQAAFRAGLAAARRIIEKEEAA